MKAVILAGGLGTRLSEETTQIPKPMVEIGGKPILWHVMKIYSLHGIKDFIICGGYKQNVIKDYFLNYKYHNSNIQIDLQNNKVTTLDSAYVEPWNISIIDTGQYSGTGDRLAQIRKYLGSDRQFCMTYGDSLGNVDIQKLIKKHNTIGASVTLTAVQPAGRYGNLTLDNTRIVEFGEKQDTINQWVNGGFFVINTSALDFISGVTNVTPISWESDVLPLIAQHEQLFCYKHTGFWYAMDTLRDKQYLQQRYEQDDNPPWLI